MTVRKTVPRRFLFDTLEALVRIGGSGTIVQFSAESGYELNTFARYSMRLQRMGLVDSPFGSRGRKHYGSIYVITEMGKIALAIEMGCRTKARAAKAIAKAVPPRVSAPDTASYGEPGAIRPCLLSS